MIDFNSAKCDINLSNQRRDFRASGRRIVPVFVCFCVSVLAAGEVQRVHAQATTAADKGEIPAPVNQALPVPGVQLQTTYYKSTMGAEAPVVVLLHMKDGNRFVWQNGFAERLQADGYAVITVDLRGHGESRPGLQSATAGGNANQDADQKKKSGDSRPASKQPASNDLKSADYQAMVAVDMEAVKKFIYDEHQASNLNMNKMGIVGPEMGASVAVNFALLDWLKTPHPDGRGEFRTPRGQDVRALVLISPQSSFQGLVTSKAMRALRTPNWNIAFLVGVGKNDPDDRGQAKKLFQEVSSFPKSEERMYYYEYNGAVRGTDLLGNSTPLEDHMLAFFRKHLMDAPGTWRDRRSKLESKR